MPRDAAARLSPGGNGEPATVEIAQKAVSLLPGQTAARDYRAYLGPKETELLRAAGGASLERAIQKGWFPPLTNFFTAVLVATHGVIPNYGVAIILITIVVRRLMYPVMQRADALDEAHERDPAAAEGRSRRSTRTTSSGSPRR